MAWVDLSGAFGFGTKLTSAQQQNLRDNIAAAFNKDSGAPVLANDYIVAAMLATDSVTADAIVTGGVGQSEIGASAVGQGELKTTTGEVSTAATRANLTLPGGTYGFYPQVKMSTTSSAAWFANIIHQSGDVGWTSYVTNITLGNENGYTLYAQHRYLQASPPYKIGDNVWGHFIFILKDKTTGKIIAMYEAEDPPWAYNGNPNNPKDSIKRVQEIPHPFIDYFIVDPLADNLEIDLIDLSTINQELLIENKNKSNNSTDFLISELKLNSINQKVDVSLPIIDGFTNKIKFEKPGV
ncbi:MAG: hypothetical protein ACXAC2_17250 [Candidatus Kariarchaeaceae archaeon]|jgi:hypothetical protein